MSDQLSFLITLLYHGELLRCALKVPQEVMPSDWHEHPMASDCLAVLLGRLPLHVRLLGPIVEVQEIFEVHVCNEKEVQG